MKKTIHNKPILSEEQIIQKLEAFCAYQERCLFDVKKKMKLLGVESSEEQNFIDYLKAHNFLNEQRFVEKFTNGKLTIKKWGKNKIQQHLKSKQIESSNIDDELKDIDEATYLETLDHVLQKKNNIIKADNVHKRKQKLIIYAQQKGFEIELILKSIKKLKLE